MKIYISLEESERLIFQKLLSIKSKRKAISRRQHLLSIAIELKDEMGVEEGDRLLIFESSIDFYEIPEKEENLFLNHYKVPKGKLKLIDRKIRDEINKKISFPEDERSPEENNYYLPIRNALVNIYLLAQDRPDFSKESLKFINCFYELSDFKSNFLRTVLDNGVFPVPNKKVESDGINSLFVLRFVWLVEYLKENVLYPNKEQIDDEAYKRHLTWLRAFLNHEDLDSISTALQSIPELFIHEHDFLIGYYVASMNFGINQDQNSVTFYEKCFTGIEPYNSKKILFWTICFHSFFHEELIYLYSIKSLQSQVFKIEKIAYGFKGDFERIDLTVEHVQLSKDQRILEFLTLTKGTKNSVPIVVGPGELRSIFKNNLTQEELKFLGLEIALPLVETVIPNTVTRDKTKFQLELVVRPSEVVFYVYPESEISVYLKELKIKQRTLNKIIDKKKKVLIAFLEGKNTHLLNTYSQLVQAIHEPVFEKIILVWLIDREQEEVQSTAFDLERQMIEEHFQRLFGSMVTIIVKNKRSQKDEEIKRNLKNLLSQYRTDQIEVVDENFDDLKASWLVERNSEYFVDRNPSSSYYFCVNG